MLYDDQAARYDERVGIADDDAAAIAGAIDRIAHLGASSRVLEPGVGTGLVSVHLVRRGVRFIGFDRSPEMLAVFRRKLDESSLQAELHVADGNERWPADDGSIDVVVCSRALHHIGAAHAVDELLRVVRPDGGWLIVGRVRRLHDSPKSQLRRQMRRRLRELGVEPASHEDHVERIFLELERHGAERHEPVVAAQWSVEHRPIDSIASWEGKEGLGAREIPHDLKREVLDGVRSWALERYGDLERVLVQEEFFELASLRLRKP